MKTSYKIMKAFVISLLMVCSLSVTALAADKKTNVENFIKANCIADNKGSIRYTNGTVKAYVREKADSSYTQAVTLADGKTIIYYNQGALDLLNKQAEKAAESEKVGEKVSDLTNDMGVEANTGAASVMLSGFKPILELIIGIIVVLITLGMTLFSSFDICYIAFPVFRNKCEDAKQSGNAALTKKSDNGDVSLRWVTDDAQYAITQGTIDSGKSPWKLYFGKRAASYIFLGIILFIFLTGNISIITNIAVNVVSGIVDIIAGLAS